MLKNIWVEYVLRQLDGEGKFGPFHTEAEAYECVVEQGLCDYEIKKIVSYVPF